MHNETIVWIYIIVLVLYLLTVNPAIIINYLRKNNDKKVTAKQWMRLVLIFQALPLISFEIVAFVFGGPWSGQAILVLILLPLIYLVGFSTLAFLLGNALQNSSIGRKTIATRGNNATGISKPRNSQ